MPDASATSIAIMGRVEGAERAAAILNAAHHEGLGDHSEPVRQATLARLMLDAASGGSPLSLSIHDACGGQLPRTEGACREAGLRYARADDGHYAYPPTNESWDGRRAHVAGGTTETGPQISLCRLTGALDAGGPEALAGMVAELRASFADDLPFALDEAAQGWLAKVAEGEVGPLTQEAHAAPSCDRTASAWLGW